MSNLSNNENAVGVEPVLLDPFLGYELSERYKIIDLIGMGGWASVYRGRHLLLGTDVAIKIIHKHLAKDPQNVKRIEQEAKLLSRVESPHIVRLLDYGNQPAPYLVMEYFDGTPLDEWLEKNGRLNYRESLELFIQLCDGLTSANDLDLVHRDLKPSNTLLKMSAGKLQAMILDFGIAKLMGSGEKNLTATGEILGTPAYMPPEQWAGRADHRSDIYSLACIIYEALTGRRAFNAVNGGIEFLEQHLDSRPTSLRQLVDENIPSTFEEIILKCLQKLPEYRYQTSRELREDLALVESGCNPKIKVRNKYWLATKNNRYRALLISVTAISLMVVFSIKVGDTLIKYLGRLGQLSIPINASGVSGSINFVRDKAPVPAPAAGVTKQSGKALPKNNASK